MLSIIASTFIGTIILAADTNINISEPPRPQKRYQEFLEKFNLVQHINLPTRKGTKIIDHIITNTNVLSCPSISKHDAPYIIAKIPTNKYQPHYKFIRDMKKFYLQKYIDDFKQLPFSIVYSFDNPDDLLDSLNKIIFECIERHASLKRTKFTRPPVSWMKDVDIVALQNQRNKLKYEALSKRTRSARVAYRKGRNKIKQKRNTTKTFYKNIFNSKIFSLMSAQARNY